MVTGLPIVLLGAPGALLGLLDMLCRPLGAEKGNRAAAGLRAIHDMSEGQRVRHGNTHVVDEFGACLHKATAAKFIQQHMREAAPKGGRVGRYTAVTSAACINDDRDGDGFRYNQFYQLRRISTSGSMVETQVNVVRIVELRKAVGSAVHPRLGIRKSDASTAQAVVCEYVQNPQDNSEYTFDRATTVWQCVPLANFGCRVTVEETASNSIKIVEYHATEGGKQLSSIPARVMDISHGFESLAGVGDGKSLSRWKKSELQDECMARQLPKSGNKQTLVARITQHFWSTVFEDVAEDEDDTPQDDANTALPSRHAAPPSTSVNEGNVAILQQHAVPPPSLMLQHSAAPSVAGACPSIMHASIGINGLAATQTTTHTAQMHPPVHHSWLTMGQNQPIAPYPAQYTHYANMTHQPTTVMLPPVLQQPQVHYSIPAPSMVASFQAVPQVARGNPPAVQHTIHRPAIHYDPQLLTFALLGYAGQWSH